MEIKNIIIAAAIYIIFGVVFLISWHYALGIYLILGLVYTIWAMFESINWISPIHWFWILTFLFWPFGIGWLVD